MYKTLPNYVSLLVCMLLPCASLWPGVYIFLCLHSWVSLFLPLSVFDTLCPFYLYLCVFPSVCHPDHHCSRVFTMDVSGFVFLTACVSVSAYTLVCISLLHSCFLPLGTACVCAFLSCLLPFMWVSLGVHVSVCLLFSLCLSVEHACGRIDRQEKLPWYTLSLRPSMSVKRLKEMI